MASEVMVFVAFDHRARPVAPGEATEAVRAAKLGGTVEPHGPWGFAVGPYDLAPLSVSLNADAHVAAEARELAGAALANTGDTALAERLRATTARFEVWWDLRTDRDVVPETAELVTQCADVLARLVGGTAVVGGTGVPITPTTDPSAALAQLFG